MEAENSSTKERTRTAPARRRAASNTSSLPTIAPLCVCAARLPAVLRPALSTITGLALAAARSALMKRRALAMPSMYTTMLCVLPSAARKSSTCAMSTTVFGPSETTCEKPTEFWLAQSRMDAVSAPDCDTRASGPAAASGPTALAFRPMLARWKPRLLGPSRCMPWRLATRCISPASAAGMPLPTTRAALHLMRPATSSASMVSAGGSAITARSARVCARSARVPVVWMSRNTRLPLKRWAVSASTRAAACGVCVSGLSLLAKTAIDSGWNSGVR